MSLQRLSPKEAKEKIEKMIDGLQNKKLAEEVSKVFEQTDFQDPEDFTSGIGMYGMFKGADSLINKWRNRPDALLDGDRNNFLEGLEDDPVNELFTAIVMENTERYLNNLQEDTKSAQIGNYDKYAFHLIRAVYPNLVAQEVVSIQPMTGPTSMIFYLDFVYGSTRGNMTKGESALSSTLGPSGNAYFSSEFIEAEVLGVGDGGTATFTGTSSYAPIVPGTFTVTAGSVEGADDGTGTISGTGISAGTVNYATGAVSVTFGSNPSAGDNVSMNYKTDFESSGDNIGQIDINLISSPVNAQTRALRARWSLIAAQNLQSQFGLNADLEATSAIAEIIKQEIDREIINDLIRIADAGTKTFDKKVPSGISYTEHKLGFEDTLVEGSNLVFSATKRSHTNWLIGGTDVTAIIQTLPGFRPEVLPSAGGVRRIGQYKQWTIYSDPYLSKGKFLTGYKGTSFFDAGYVYAPYIPFVATPTVTLDDLVSRRGMMTQFAKKSVNPKFYSDGNVVDTT